MIVRPGNCAGFTIGFDRPQGGAPLAPIIFKAQRGATITTRNARTPDAINLERAGYVIIDGFTIAEDSHTIGRAGIRSVRNHDVIIRNNVVDGAGYRGIFTGFSDNVRIEGNTTSHSAKQHGIYVSNTCQNPVIRGSTVFGNRGGGIHLNGDAEQGGKGVITSALIENNIICENGIGGGSAINCDGLQSSIIRNNLLYNNHAHGISRHGAAPLIRINTHPLRTPLRSSPMRPALGPGR